MSLEKEGTREQSLFSKCGGGKETSVGGDDGEKRKSGGRFFVRQGFPSILVQRGSARSWTSGVGVVDFCGCGARFGRSSAVKDSAGAFSRGGDPKVKARRLHRAEIPKNAAGHSIGWAASQHPTRQELSPTLFADPCPIAQRTFTNSSQETFFLR